MKRIRDKETGYVDYIGKWSELVPYVLGCAISGNSKELKIRAYGPVPDLKNIILQTLPKRNKRKKKIWKKIKN